MRLEAAYEQYADMLYRLALSHLKNREDAEDAVQDAFIKYMHHILPFSDEEHERAWLIRVTVNHCYDVLRYKSRRNYEALEDITEIAAEEKELNTGIFQILEQLPIKNRTVLVLHYLEGFSVQEIARMLQISASAVKMRLARGRKQMKEEMEKEKEHV